MLLPAPVGRTRGGLIILLVAVVSAVLVFGLIIKPNLNADENVFIASGSLLRSGLLPYRDYQYNHMPTLIFIYAMLFSVSDHLLLIARIFEGLCAVLAVVSVFCATWYWCRTWAKGGVALAAGIALLFLTNPLFTYTAGQAWNHDFPLLGCLAGVLALMYGIARRRVVLWSLLAGVLFGLSVTARLSYATAGLPVVLFVIFYPGITFRRRGMIFLMLAIGFFVVSLPSAWVWAQSPANAFFGNFLYPALNTRYHAANVRHGHLPFSIAARLWYLVTTCLTLPGNGVVTILFIFLLVAGFRPREIRRDPKQSQLGFIALIVICLTAGAFAASPLYRQYMYAATPFMILGIARLLTMMPDQLQRRRFRRVLIACVSLSTVFGIAEYNGLLLLPHLDRWQPMSIHAAGVEIVDRVGDGRILTLDPAYILEGKGKIFPELATGRFVVRAAPYLTGAQRATYKMLDADEIIQAIDRNEPRGILLTGTAVRVEPRLAAAARAAGYTSTDIPPIGTLWRSRRDRASR